MWRGLAGARLAAVLLAAGAGAEDALACGRASREASRDASSGCFDQSHDRRLGGASCSVAAQQCSSHGTEAAAQRCPQAEQNITLTQREEACPSQSCSGSGENSDDDAKTVTTATATAAVGCQLRLPGAVTVRLALKGVGGVPSLAKSSQFVNRSAADWVLSMLPSFWSSATTATAASHAPGIAALSGCFSLPAAEQTAATRDTQHSQHTTRQSAQDTAVSSTQHGSQHAYGRCGACSGWFEANWHQVLGAGTDKAPRASMGADGPHHLVLSICPVMSCPVLSCHVPSFLVLSAPTCCSH